MPVTYYAKFLGSPGPTTFRREKGWSSWNDIEIDDGRKINQRPPKTVPYRIVCFWEGDIHNLLVDLSHAWGSGRRIPKVEIVGLRSPGPKAGPDGTLFRHLLLSEVLVTAADLGGASCRIQPSFYLPPRDGLPEVNVPDRRICVQSHDPRIELEVERTNVTWIFPAVQEA